MKTEVVHLFQCAYCAKEFKYKSEKKRHEQSHTHFYDCTICHKKFNFMSALRRHVKLHNRKDKVHCKECEGAFRDEILLKRHMKYAHKGTYTCKSCNSIFNSETALKTHAFTHKPKNERRYKCNYEGCYKSFNFKHHLTHHEMVHQNNKQHICNTCGKGFIQLHHLKSHLNIHNPDKWLYCTISNCNKKFPTEYARKRHFTLHTNIKEIDTFEKKIDVKSGTDVQLSDYDSHMVTKCEEIEVSETKSIPKKDNNQCNSKIEHIKDIPGDKDCELPCKDIFGGCLVTGTSEVTDDCLCAQISTTKEQEKIMPFTGLQTTEPNNCENRDVTCSDCKCLINDKINNNNKACKISRDTPAMEYRFDGTIKLKETFDTDILIMKKYSEPVKNKVKYFIPFNSCKAVLGNCIVSEDGKVGDGCLCAKMAIYDDQVNTEEIDEITPLNLTDLRT